jgi:hypothetical protein
MAVLLCRNHVCTGTYHDSCSAQDSIKAIPCNNNNENKKNSNDNYGGGAGGGDDDDDDDGGGGGGGGGCDDDDDDGDDDIVGSGKFSRWLNSKNKITAINILAVSVQCAPLEWSPG